METLQAALEQFLGLWHYFGAITLMMIGLYMVIARDNLVKKMMGLNIFQVAVIMFYVSIGKVSGGTAPIYIEMPHAESHEATGSDHASSEGHAPPVHASSDHGGADHAGSESAGSHASVAPSPDSHGEAHPAEHSEAPVFSNPLPHVLMLTAIVVGVAVTALGLSFIVRIRESFGTVEEDEIIGIIAAEDLAEASPDPHENPPLAEVG